MYLCYQKCQNSTFSLPMVRVIAFKSCSSPFLLAKRTEHGIDWGMKQVMEKGYSRSDATWPHDHLSANEMAWTNLWTGPLGAERLGTFVSYVSWSRVTCVMRPRWRHSVYCVWWFASCPTPCPTHINRWPIRRLEQIYGWSHWLECTKSRLQCMKVAGGPTHKLDQLLLTGWWWSRQLAIAWQTRRSNLAGQSIVSTGFLTLIWALADLVLGCHLFIISW